MNLILVLKEVFSKRKYLFITFLISIFFYSLNVIISSWRVFGEFSSDKSFFGAIKVFLFLFLNMGQIMKMSSWISLILISVLLGILFSLIFYKVKMNFSSDNKIGLLGIFGVFLAAFVPGCAACGVGLISVLGLSAGILSIFPFGGFELSLLSILILIFAIFKITKNMYICKVSNSFVKDENTKKKEEK
ncbi:hypothetical protein GW931_00005 [archaeon]|nr:hypothetical protein [archaeon]PJC45344.1 MAG: hypothetical protein CO037_01995 [Candidatus Pacearchaeota archaeon CG_4_9_14_0_2_um_filter_30_8]